jgi:hypothetical protein
MKRSFSFLYLILFAWPCLGQLSPIQLGNSSNAYSSLLIQQNSVFAIDSLNVVGFIHRQDITIWGGGSPANGKLCYDVSSNSGQSFTNDVGTFNSTYINAARFPSITAYNPSGSSNPADMKLIWTGSTLNPSYYFDGFAAGVSDYTIGTIASTEDYFYQGFYEMIPGGLCMGKPGEFWMATHEGEMAGIDSFPVVTSKGDSLIIFKGIYNTLTSDINWMIYQKKKIDYDLSYDGTIHNTIPNMAFSPDGNTGWIAFVGDLAGGPSHNNYPIFIKSSDGGVNWDAPVEVNLNTILWIKDSLISVGSLFFPGLDQDFDLTVDANGNPHMFAHVGGSEAYQLDRSGASVLWHAFVDITTDNGGLSWYVHNISHAYTFDGTFGSSEEITMNHFLQIARSEDGENLFYSWAESDWNEIGLYVVNNYAPNLLIKSFNPFTHEQSQVINVTEGDLNWDGNALFPILSPTVLSTDSTFLLPIVIMSMPTNDPSQPCEYFYFGNDAHIDKFCHQDTGVNKVGNTLWADATIGHYQWLDCGNAFSAVPGAISKSFTPSVTGSYAVKISLGNCVDTSACILVDLSSVNENDHGQAILVAPNPCTSSVRITLPQDITEGTLTMSSSDGHCVIKKIFSKGGTIDLDTRGISPGAYILGIYTDKTVFRKLLVVQ